MEPGPTLRRSDASRLSPNLTTTSLRNPTFKLPASVTYRRVGETVLVTVELEFWPEYDSGPLWDREGAAVDLESLRVSQDLRSQVVRWNAEYSDCRLPFESNDVAWLAEGRPLLDQLRLELSGTYSIVVREPWWGEEPDE